MDKPGRSGGRSDLTFPGRFITFEGGEGAGKSTQVQRVQARLEALGIAVVTTREPGGSPHAERIRDLLLSGAAREHGPFAEALLFAAARADHVEHTIRPALARGALVLCDRFTDSTRVYQGAVAGLEDDLLDGLETISLSGTRPDLTLILDVDTATGLARATARRQRLGQEADRFEAEAEEFHGRVRQAFLAIAAADPDRCAVIDAGRDPDEVEQRIWAAIVARGFASPLAGQGGA